MELLVSYLEQPDSTQWAKLALTYALGWLAAGPLQGTSEADTLEGRLQTDPLRFDQPAPAPVSPDEPVQSRQHWDPWFVALARCSTAAVRNGRLVIRVVLRLFDEHDGRRGREFEASWRAFLNAWNLLQFHERIGVYSSEFMAGASFVAAAVPMGGASIAAESPEAGVPESSNEALEELLKYSTATSLSMSSSFRSRMRRPPVFSSTSV